MASDKDNEKLMDLYLQLKKEIDKKNDLIPLRLYSPTSSNLTPERVERIIADTGKLRNKKAVPLLLKYLKDPDKKIRVTTVKALGKISDKRSINPLLTLLNDYYTTVIFHTIESLGRILTGEIEATKYDYKFGFGEITPLNYEKVQEKNKREASQIPEKTIEKVRKSILKFSDDKKSTLRRKSAEWIGKIGDEKDLKSIEKLLDDKNEFVKKSASNALNILSARDLLSNFYEKVYVSFIDPIENSFGLECQKFCEYTINNENNDISTEIQQFTLNKLSSLNSIDKIMYKNWLNNVLTGNYEKTNNIKEFAPLYVASLEYLLLLNKITLETILEKYNAINEAYIDNKIEYLHDINLFQIESSCIYSSETTQMPMYDKEVPAICLRSHLKFCLKLWVQNHEYKMDYITGKVLLYLDANHTLTEFGNKNQEEISKIADSLLEKFKKKQGMPLFKYLIQNSAEITNNNLESYKIFFDDDEDFLKFKKRYEVCIIGVSDYAQTNILKVNEAIFELTRDIIARLLRESENRYREKIGAPKVGEGWISETELYYKIKETFSNEKVIFHGRPSWLGQQHLDIYLPKKNIAIEYQGIQHNEPVDYFGGEEKFEHTKFLDERKLKKCKENGCELIYVYPGYNFEDVKNKIEKLL